MCVWFGIQYEVLRFFPMGSSVSFRLILANTLIFRVPNLNRRGFNSLDILLVEKLNFLLGKIKSA